MDILAQMANERYEEELKGYPAAQTKKKSKKTIPVVSRKGIWVAALKEWNASKKNRGTWCIPRKSSAEYVEVRKIMDRMIAE